VGHAERVILAQIARIVGTVTTPSAADPGGWPVTLRDTLANDVRAVRRRRIGRRFTRRVYG
jgi:hypothetical protein